MSDHKSEKKVTPPKAFGWMAEYDDEHKFLDAARKVRDSGYTRTDAFAPFPVHGIDEALGIKPTVLPWFTLIAGACGTTTAFVMQIWMNGYSYPYIISGKPFISLPAFIPVAFELTVLFAAFTTVFAMLGLNGLPKFSNPVFTNPNFDRATDDRFFIWVDSRDKYFNSEKVKALLAGTSPVSIDEVREDDSPSSVPRFLYTAFGVLILVSLIPAVLVWNMRAVRTGNPRWHVFFDMDFMPYRKAQKETTLFADGKTQRPPVPGTVARGDFAVDDPMYLGFTPDAAAAQRMDTQSSDALRYVSLQDGAAQDGGSAQGVAVVPDRNYLSKLPEQLEANDELFALGRNKFEQVCSACHGYSGYGNGLVSKRAEALQASYWLQPTSVHDERIQKQAIGQIYYTITNGKGKMAGYGSTLNVKERWAVALYVKALQKSQNASAPGVGNQ